MIRVVELKWHTILLTLVENLEAEVPVWVSDTNGFVPYSNTLLMALMVANAARYTVISDTQHSGFKLPTYGNQTRSYVTRRWESASDWYEYRTFNGKDFEFRYFAHGPWIQKINLHSWSQIEKHMLNYVGMKEVQADPLTNGMYKYLSNGIYIECLDSDSGEEIAAKTKAAIETFNSGSAPKPAPSKCRCEWVALLTYGCKCGGI